DLPERNSKLLHIISRPAVDVSDASIDPQQSVEQDGHYAAADIYRLGIGRYAESLNATEGIPETSIRADVVLCVFDEVLTFGDVPIALVELSFGNSHHQVLARRVCW